ncbi:MAG TPA: BlaI/MecI/CopY family transcriptional regulator [Candidatus Polarisedimenticolaceae bacterium]|nr:BlaI/MecI/CopY family transcriptional regulator [Candidatus Polarisedimenticolaceae bacterium]
MRNKPTAAELTILRTLWALGPSTVRQVHDAREETATGYTTTLKLLQIMADKGLVRRNESQRAHVYEARLPREKTQAQLVRDLVDSVFGGSASRLVVHALAAKPSSPAERQEIRRLLDAMEEKRR